MHLAPELITELIAHVTAVAPAEGCGLLAMDAGGVVRRVYCLANVVDSPVRFTVDPDGHVAALRDAEANGWSFVKKQADVLLLVAGVLLFGSGIGNTTSLPPLIAQVEFGKADVQRVVPLIVAITGARKAASRSRL